MTRRIAFATTLAALAPLTAGCHLSFGSSYPTVNGVELSKKHIETLAEVDLSAGLEIAASMGSVRVETSPGPTEIAVTLYEATEGDAYAAFEGGKLVTKTHSGEPSAIGDVTVRTSETLGPLVLTSGIGDIEVRGVAVAGSVNADTGMGDVVVEGVGDVTVLFVSSGMGDVEVSGLRCETLEASSGMGDVEVVEVVGASATLSTGMGDVEVDGSRFATFDASSGMGDVNCTNSDLESTDISTGLGSSSVR